MRRWEDRLRTEDASTGKGGGDRQPLRGGLLITVVVIEDDEEEPRDGKVS